MKEYSEELFQEGENNARLKELIFQFLGYWPWFIASLVICLIAAKVYLRYATPIYSVSATIMLKEDKYSQSAGSELSALANMGFATSGTGIENKMEILRSKSLISQAVTELKTYVSYGTKGTIGSRDLYTDSPVCVDLDSLSLAHLTFGIAFQAVLHPDSSLTLTGNVGGQLLDRTLKKLPAAVTTPAGTLLFSLRSGGEPLFEEIIYIQVSPPLEVAKGYLSTLSVGNKEKANAVVDITFKTGNSRRGADFVNQLVNVYNRETNDDKNQVITRTDQFINDRLAIISRELGSTEKELEDVKRKAGLLDLSSATEFMSGKEEYDKKLIDLDTRRQLIAYLDEYIRQPENANGVIPANVGAETDATLTALINAYNEQAVERNRLLRASSEDNPVIVRLTSSLTSLHAQLLTATRSALHSLSIARRDLERQAGKYAGRINSAPTQERIFTGIARQQEIKAGLYLMLLQKREENSIALAATADDAKVIDAAEAGSTPVSPNSALIRAVALAAGLLLPVIIITLLNFFRLRIEGRADVEKLTSVPILGDVPLIKTKSKNKEERYIAVKENDNSLMSEAFRSLRTNLQFTLRQPDHKIILVTSTTSGEGKTFVSSNLAVSLALLGKRVILVGLDIRAPKLAEQFGIATKHPRGLTDYLAAPSDTDINGLLHDSGYPNLRILLSGTIPPNPSELLARPALEEAIGALALQADYLILDSAPVGMVTDTLITARVAHSTVYVCRANTTFKKDFELVNELSRMSKLPAISLVVNATDMSGKKYGYHYGYGRKYGYGYGYGYGQKKNNEK